MTDIHSPLYIPGPIFDQFISAILAEAALQMPPLMFSSGQTTAILGLKPQIIDADASTADGGVLAFGWQNAGDAGTVSDAGDGGDADAAP